MYRISTFHILSFFVLLILPGTAMAESLSLPAEEVAAKVYHRDIGSDMQMSGTMELISAGGQKRIREYISLRLDSTTERRSVIRFTAPADIAGTGFLVREDLKTGMTEQHLYLPALKRTRRIVTSQQGRNFVNTDFTFEDMQRQPLDSWDYRLDAATECQHHSCQILISTPKPATDSQYSKIVLQIDGYSFMPVQIDFYDHRQRHSKRYQVIHREMIDGIATEMEVVMEDLLSGHRTRLITHQIRYNIGLPEHLFTTRALEQ